MVKMTSFFLSFSACIAIGFTTGQQQLTSNSTESSLASKTLENSTTATETYTTGTLILDVTSSPTSTVAEYATFARQTTVTSAMMSTSSSARPILSESVSSVASGAQNNLTLTTTSPLEPSPEQRGLNIPIRLDRANPTDNIISIATNSMNSSMTSSPSVLDTNQSLSSAEATTLSSLQTPTSTSLKSSSPSIQSTRKLSSSTPSLQSTPKLSSSTPSSSSPPPPSSSSSSLSSSSSFQTSQIPTSSSSQPPFTPTTTLAPPMSSSATASPSTSQNQPYSGQYTTGSTEDNTSASARTKEAVYDVTTSQTPTTTKGSVENAKHNTSMARQCEETTFGKYGLPLAGVMTLLCVLLLITVIALAIRQKGLKQQKLDEETSVPKLKMLEVKESVLRRPVTGNDDLQTYSLDYEKKVQEKIEEHKRTLKPAVAPKPAAVSTFKLAKKPSLMSSTSEVSSAPSSPLSPMSPTAAEEKPLLKQKPDADDDVNVFTYNAKRPSEILTSRRPSNMDDLDRRKSNASNKSKTNTPDVVDLFESDV